MSYRGDFVDEPTNDLDISRSSSSPEKTFATSRAYAYDARLAVRSIPSVPRNVGFFVSPALSQSSIEASP